MLTRAQQLQDRARRCRELAESAMTEEGRAILIEIAERYEREASLEQSRPAPAALPDPVA